MNEIKIKCFEVVSMIVDEATRQFSPIWAPNEEKYNILKQYCSVIDDLAKEFNGESIEVEVDDINMTIDVSLECWDLKLESSDHIFHKLVKRSVSVGFSVSNDGNLNVTFVFPSIWERAV